MRVAYICADLGVPIFGSKGCSVHVQEIVRCFQNLGHTVELFVARVGGEPPKDLAECVVHVFPPEPAHSVEGREQVAKGVADRILAALECQGPFDMVYERHSLWSASGPRYSVNRSSPCLLEVNAPLIQEQMQHRELRDVDGAYRLSQEALSLATSVTVVSEELLDSIHNDFIVDRRKMQVVPNGVDTDRFSPAIPKRCKSDDYTIGFVGSLKPWHGVETLIEAFRIVQEKIENSRLLIVGDGPMRTKLQQDLNGAATDVSDRVEWVGAVRPEEVPGYLTSMDVAVAPYPDNAGFYFSPLKAYESMACGLVTVASAIGQLSSIIRHGVDGFLYPAGSVAALASELSFLADHPDLRVQVGNNARLRAVNEFTWESVLTRSLACLETSRFALNEQRGG